MCRRHLPMYAAMVKSLLRFFNGVAVVAHDDGTLTDGDKRSLQRQVKGIKVIRRGAADKRIGKLIAPFPHCKRYRDNRPNALQLFDFAPYSRSGKIIAVDSDILFLQKPRALVEWARKRERDHPLVRRMAVAAGAFSLSVRMRVPPALQPGPPVFLCRYHRSRSHRVHPEANG